MATGDGPEPDRDAPDIETPRGTWAVMALFAVGFFAAWLLLFFGRFLAAGHVS